MEFRTLTLADLDLLQDRWGLGRPRLSLAAVATKHRTTPATVRERESRAMRSVEFVAALSRALQFHRLLAEEVTR